MRPNDEIKEAEESAPRQQTEEQAGRGSMSCQMCGDCGECKSPMKKMMGKGPNTMMQMMPAMCMAFMVVTTALLGVAVGVMIGRANTRTR